GPPPEGRPARSGAAAAGTPAAAAAPPARNPGGAGVGGGLSIFGEALVPADVPALPPARSTAALVAPARKPAVIVQGYPAFDAPLVHFALRRQRVPVDIRKSAWLDTADYARYDFVVLVGDLARPKVEPNKFRAEDLARVKRYLEEGGTFLLMRGTTAVFATPEGRAFLSGLTGAGAAGRGAEPEIRLPDHPWVRHLKRGEAYP